MKQAMAPSQRVLTPRQFKALCSSLFGHGFEYDPIHGSPYKKAGPWTLTVLPASINDVDRGRSTSVTWHARNRELHGDLKALLPLVFDKKLISLDSGVDADFTDLQLTPTTIAQFLKSPDIFDAAIKAMLGFGGFRHAVDAVQFLEVVRAAREHIRADSLFFNVLPMAEESPRLRLSTWIEQMAALPAVRKAIAILADKEPNHKGQ